VHSPRVQRAIIMPRFSLSPARLSAAHPPAGGGGGGNPSLLLSPEAEAEAEAVKYRESTAMATDEESSYEGSASVSSSDDQYSTSEDEDDDGDEPPHPLGFPKSYGRTRFVVDPSDIIIEENKDKRCIYDDWFDPADYETHRPLPTAGTRSSVGIGEVGTAALLAHHHGRRRGRSRNANGAAAGDVDSLTSSMDRIAALVGAATYLGDRDDAEVLNGATRNGTSTAVVPSSDGSASTKLWQLAEAAEQQRREIAQKGRIERGKAIAEQERAASILRKLIERDQKAADDILERERIERERAEAAERRRLEAERAEEERLAQEEKARAEAEAARAEGQRRADEVAQQERAEEAEALAQRKTEVKAKLEAEAAQKTEHITKAKNLMDRLVEVRASLESFETNKAVSKRRLQFKKVVRGRLNTLSHEADKIRAVSSDVVNAVNAARAEDEQIKSQLEETGTLADGGLSPDMGRGKRYLLDLLCSNVIVRVQAEGFNGTRGDGFPLAAVLTSISVEVKEFTPLLAAHLYTACPATIPMLPDIADNASETALMDGLGMIKDKKGEYETFDRFLTRTEGLVSIIANIMASIPTDHTLLGGHNGALDWLGRFLDLLPPAPQEPLPLVTAPVLVAFLAGAGHMLANKFPDEFKAQLDIVVNDVSKRLDVGTIGQPSATRLKKILDSGFEGFRTTLPPGAVEMYYDASSIGESVSVPPSLAGPTTASAAAAATAGDVAPAPFGGTAGGMSGSGFGQSTGFHSGTGFAGTQPHTQANPFGQAPATSGGQASPFGPPQGMVQQPDTFGQSQGATQPSPFGGGSGGGGGIGGIGGSNFTNTGAGAGQSNKPPCKYFAQGGNCRFGSNCRFSHDIGASRGGSGVGSGGGAAASTAGGMAGAGPFGATTNPQFGASASSSNTNNPFGGGSTSAPGSSPFNTGEATSNPSPFGQQQSTGNSNVFGGQQQQQPSNPFGSPSAQQPTTSSYNAFGGQQQSNPFGSTQAPAPSPFGDGQTQPTNNPFGSQTQASPFGSGGGGGGGTGGIGGGGAGSSNPFGGGGGGEGSRSSSFGGGSNKKPPCRFFAKGSCRYGANCKFSHDTGGSNQNNSAPSFGGAFGGVAPAPSPFGGGAGGCGFGLAMTGASPFTGGLSNPFGGPRR